MLGAMVALQYFQQLQPKFSVAASYPETIDISAHMDRDQARKFGGYGKVRPPRVVVLDDIACRNALAVKALQCERNWERKFGTAGSGALAYDSI